MISKMRQLKQVSQPKTVIRSLLATKNYVFLLILGLFLPPSVLSAQCLITVNASASNCYDSNGNQAGGTSVTNVQTVVSWINAPSGETITVSCTGATNQTINPTTTTSPAVVIFQVPSNGASLNVQAVFSTTMACTDTKSVTVPSSNCLLTPCQSGNVGGTVWRDFNSNGVKDVNETDGLAGATVRAYDCTGNLIETVTTDYLGQYVFTNVTPSVLQPVRIEFATNSTLYKATLLGTDNNSDVRFVTAASCNLNYGVNNPADYCQTNPSLIINCYITGAYNSGSGTGHTIVGLPYNHTQDPDGNVNGTTAAGAVTFDPPIYTPAPPEPDAIADHNQVGSTWGLAYDRDRKNLFVAAYVKAGTSLGPSDESTGKIYKITDPLGTKTTTDYVDLNTIFGATTTGINPHPSATTSYNQLDDAATNAVIGKVGLGDMAISNDGAFLYVVNLADKKLYKIPTTGALNSTTIQRFDIPTTGQPTVTDAIGTAGTCPDADVRPFGLGVHPDGTVYVGGVCSCESLSSGFNAEPNNASYQLTAYVWSFNGTSFTRVLNESLRFDRDNNGGYTTGDNFASNSPRNQDWEPWHDLSDAAIYNTQNPAQNEPMLADISFDENGDMYLGMRDRLGDCVTLNGGFLSSGDIYKVAKTPVGWALEKNATAGAITTSGANNKQGPAGGEFIYTDIQGDGIKNSGTGGVFNLMGTHQVASTAIDAVYLTSTGQTFFNPSAGGIQIFGTQDGALKGAYNLYEVNDINTFAKAAGIGAVAAVCSPAPKQIGNFVWVDTDKDGVQDPCETPLSNVNVRLYKMGTGGTTLVATTTTNSSGVYYFTDSDEASGFDTLMTDAMYFVVVGESGQFNTTSQKLTIGGITYELGRQNNGTGTNADLHDSDAFVLNDAAKPFNGYPVDTLTVGGAGFVNHTLDFGFQIPCTPATITNVAFDTAKCVNGVMGSDAWVAVRGITGMAKYAVRTNATDSLWNNTATASTADSIRISNIPNPATATTYTFRIWGTDTTCFNDTTVILPPSVCPPCSITGTFTQNSCNNNGTTAHSNDDHFTVTVSAVSATNGGTSGKYEVVLMPAGTVLNAGGTNYGTPITVGGAGIFSANGTATYILKVRDLDIAGCESSVFTTTATAACSVIPCPPQVCIQVTVARN
jgi:SdrD B-like domain